MTSAIAKHDVTTLTEKQINAFHHWASTDARLSSMNYYHHEQCAWVDTIYHSLPADSSGITRKYTIDKNMHKLQTLKCVQPLPALEVKPEHQDTVQLAWSHDCAPSCVDTGTLYNDTTEIGHIDNVTMAFDFQYFRNVAKEREIDGDMGNITIIEDFAQKLPAHPVSCDLKFGFAWYTGTALPLHLMNQKPTSCSLTFKREICSILRMRMRKDKNSPWESVEGVDTETLNQYVKGMSSNGELPEPEIIGAYSFMSDRELKETNCDSSYSFWYPDWVTMEVSNSHKYGSEVNVNIKSGYPCLGIFIQTENQTAVRYHNFSNGTTDADNVHKGYDAMTQIRFKQGEVNRFQGISNHILRGTTKDDKTKEGISVELLNQMQANCYPSNPSTHGYTSIAFCRMMDLRDLRVTQIFTGKNESILTIKLGKWDPYLKPPHGDISVTEKKPKDLTFVPDDTEYKINVRALVLRELKIEIVNGEQKLTYN